MSSGMDMHTGVQKEILVTGDDQSTSSLLLIHQKKTRISWILYVKPLRMF